MNRLMKARIGLVLAALLGAASAAAETPPAPQFELKPSVPRPNAIETSPGGLLQFVPGTNVGIFLASATSQFTKLDADHDGVLTERDIPLLREAGDQSRIRVLKFDFDRMDANHDGILTNEEVQVFYAQQLKEIEEKFVSAKRQPVDPVAYLTTELRIRVQEFLALDTNRDGRIDAAELQAGQWVTIGGAWAETGDELVSQLARARSITGGAPQDISKEAYLKAAEAYFHKVDTDHNGQISLAEQDAEAAAVAAAACELPKPSPTAQVVVLSGYVPMISMVAVGGQQTETKAARLIVEDGATPLYVIVIPPVDAVLLDSGITALWKVEGRIDRIERFVVAAPTRVGVSGLSGDLVTFLRGHGCLAQPLPDSNNAYARAYNELAKAFNAEALARIGAAASAVDVAYRDDVAVALPSGQSAGKLPTLSWDDPSTWVPAVDGSAVISTDPVAPYQTAPGAIGIQQLLKQGKITHTGEPAEFLVKSDFEFPPGKPWGKFSVPAGVPIPRGDPGNACVFSLEAGGFVGRTVRKCSRVPM